jgi:serine protease Do
MSYRIRQLLRHRRALMATVTAVAFSVLLSGLGLAAALPHSSVVASRHPQEATATRTSPDSFVELAERLSPTVVNIKVTKMAKVAPSQWSHDPDGPFGEFFKRFFKEMPQTPGPFKQQGAGSGVIISERGDILTNNHVIEGADEVLVTLTDTREFKATIVGRDAKTGG